jgi:hypothetical protein
MALAGALGGLLAFSAPEAAGQALVHRYSFNGGAADSVGEADGTVVGNVTFQADATQVNGVAVFGGGTSSASPGYVRLPVTAVSGLQNATIEIFTTNFNVPKDLFNQPGGKFQTLFAMATAYGNQTNYVVMSPNRDGAGVGVGARTYSLAENVVAAHDPLPVWRGNHVIDVVYSGFAGIGTRGTLTLYVDGLKTAQGQTAFSMARVAAAPGGVTTVGIGGGSPFNDPTFSGSICEFRIFGGALSAAQIAADVDAGPAVLGFVPAYSLGEAARALQIAAGAGPAPTSAEVNRLNVTGDGGSADGVNVADAVSIARKAAGIESNP